MTSRGRKVFGVMALSAWLAFAAACSWPTSEIVATEALGVSSPASMAASIETFRYERGGQCFVGYGDVAMTGDQRGAVASLWCVPSKAVAMAAAFALVPPLIVLLLWGGFVGVRSVLIRRIAAERF